MTGEQQPWTVRRRSILTLRLERGTEQRLIGRPTHFVWLKIFELLHREDEVPHCIVEILTAQASAVHRRIRRTKDRYAERDS